jgi:hypothetical protein
MRFMISLSNQIKHLENTANIRSREDDSTGGTVFLQIVLLRHSSPFAWN